MYCYILGENINIEKYAKDCNNWATIIAHTTIGFTFLLYVFVLDIAALVFRDSRITDTAYYKTQKNDLLFFYTVPLFLWDLIALVIFILLSVRMMMKTKICLEQLKEHLEDWSIELSDKDLFVLLATAGTVPELLCLASHAHYIIIAWMLDPIYATGIGIYYSIFYVMHLAVLTQTYKATYKVFGSSGALGAMIAVYVGTVIFQVLVTVFIVYIPINNAIENTPTRLSTIIQGVGTLFLGLIAYKIIIDPRKTSTVKSPTRNEEISDQEQAFNEISDQEQALNQNDCSCSVCTGT